MIMSMRSTKGSIVNRRRVSESIILEKSSSPVFKVQVRSPSEMFKYDKAMKEKYQPEEVEKERLYFEKDRKILERVKKINLIKQQKKLMILMKKQKQKREKDLQRAANQNPLERFYN
jgi:hypothetical protein